MSVLLAVDLIPSFLTNRDLNTAFSSFPGFLRSELIVNAQGGSVGSAVIEIATPGEALQIIQAMDGADIAGRAIRVSQLESLPQELAVAPNSSSHRGPFIPNRLAQSAIGSGASQSDVAVLTNPPITMEPDEAGRKVHREPPRQPCAHQRLIDELRDAQGNPTGKLVCAECGAVFPEPDTSQQNSG